MNTPILEEHGYFWWSEEPIPNGHLVPDSAVPGVLRIDKEGRIELELNGVLHSERGPLGSFFGDRRPLPPDRRIQGLLKSSSQYALLLGLMGNGGASRSNGISYEKYLAINCLVGGNPFPHGSKLLRFRSLNIDLKGFEEWLRLGAIETKRTKSRLTAKYRAPQNITYALEEGTLSIRHNLWGPYPGHYNRHNLTLTEGASLLYRPQKGITLEEMKAQYGLIEDLFILLTGSDYCVDWPLLTYGKERTSYRLYFWRQRNSASAPDWHECWTTFPQLRDDFGQIFSTWRKKHEEFGPGVYLYLGTRRGTKLYVEHRFVNLIWGIESLHRRKTPESEMPSNLKEKIQRILGQVNDEDDKKWLESRLRHAGEPTLEQRIFDILNNLPLDLDKKALRQFCTHCAKARNDISHFGGQRHKGNYREFVRETDKKNVALSYLYHILVLQEIGVPVQILKWWVHQGFMSYTFKGAFVEVGLLPQSALNYSLPSLKPNGHGLEKKEPEPLPSTAHVQPNS